MALPEHAKQARLDHESVATLPAHAFADPLRREFPLDEPGHTFLSYAYAKLAGVNNGVLLHTIRRAGELQGIAADLDQLDAGLFTKLASAPVAPHYALILDFGAGVKTAATRREQEGGLQGFYPLNSADETATSAHQLGNDFLRLPRDLFAQGAREVVKAALEQQVPRTQIPLRIWSYGEERVPNWDIVYEQAEKRARLTGDELYRELTLSAQDQADEDTWFKYATLWHQADVLNGVPLHPDVDLDAFQIFGSGVTKAAEAAALDEWCLLEGQPIPRKALAAIPESELRKRATAELAGQLFTVVTSATRETGAVVTEQLTRLPEGGRRLLLHLAAA
jgi:hypothetical protein